MGPSQPQSPRFQALKCAFGVKFHVVLAPKSGPHCSVFGKAISNMPSNALCRARPALKRAARAICAYYLHLYAFKLLCEVADRSYMVMRALQARARALNSLQSLRGRSAKV